MCGITGLVSSGSISGQKFYNAHKSLGHRGPDDEGFVSFDTEGNIIHLKGHKSVQQFNHLPSIDGITGQNILLGHHRLTIADISFKSHQPMVHDNIAISYNGMLYNYKEIRSSLEKFGHTFISDADTEVVLKAFCQWGKLCFSKFNGMWAVAIFDTNKKTLTMARDRYGIKPLFYSKKTNDLYFASEIKFITQLAGAGKLNPNIAFDYVRYGLLDHSHQTFFEGIYAVKPGTLIEYQSNMLSEELYCSFDNQSDVSLNDDLKTALTSSIQAQITAKKPIGALLSGGIDSGLIVAIAAQRLGKRVKTFSIDFDQKEFSERNLIEKTLDLHGLEGVFVKSNEKEMLAKLKTVLWHRETPIRSLATVSQFLLFAEIKNTSNIEVVLTGDGSDELYLGYQDDFYVYIASLLYTGKYRTLFERVAQYRDLHKLSWFSLIFKLLRNTTSNALRYRTANLKKGFAFNKLPENMQPQTIKTLLQHKLFSIRYSPLPEYLASTDRMAMSSSIESRVPFLDNVVVENALRDDGSELFLDGYSKKGLRAIADEILPAEVARNRKKIGFQTPQEAWQKNQRLQQLIDCRLKKIFIESKYTFLNNKYLLKKSEISRPSNVFDTYTVWRLYCLDVFVKTWRLEI